MPDETSGTVQQSACNTPNGASIGGRTTEGTTSAKESRGGEGEQRPMEVLHKEIFQNDEVERKVKNEVAEAVQVLEEALERFSFEELSLSFNGGKDCTVVLHLLRAVLNNKFESRPDKSISVFKVVYFQKDDEFQEMHDFMAEMKLKFELKIDMYPSDYKTGLEMMEREGLKAVFMGQRKGDPHSHNLELFTRCSPGWPNIVRINPILNWSYNTVWTFLRRCNLDYCKLYDLGFTSLGSSKTTTVNPNLIGEGGGVRPAYELEDGDEHERISRT